MMRFAIFLTSLRKTWVWRGEQGIVTATALLTSAVLALLGVTAVLVTTTDLKVGGQHKSSDLALYAAEAGTEEARARLRGTAGAYLITDASPTAAQWRAYIGKATKAQAQGYNPGQLLHLRRDSLQTSMSYLVMIRHKISGAGQVLYWGDDNGDGINTANTTVGNNIYVVASWGYAGTATRRIEIEMTRVPPIAAPSPLYVEAATTVQGSSTTIIGTDGCGSAHKPGISTTLPAGQVNFNGHPTVTGTGSTPSIVYDALNLDVQAMVDGLKGSATSSYHVTGATQSGMHWGTPTPGATQQSPSTCGVSHVVYYQTQDTYISLTGGTSGCGTLLVEGDLNIHGGFAWYGPILVTGSVTMTGGGNKNVTGAILAGGSADADMVGGNASIVYCSQAIANQTLSQPLMILTWRLP
jgi:hypothetical protein